MKILDQFDILSNLGNTFRHSILIKTEVVDVNLRDKITSNVTNYEVLQMTDKIYEGKNETN